MNSGRAFRFLVVIALAGCATVPAPRSLDALAALPELRAGPPLDPTLPPPGAQPSLCTGSTPCRAQLQALLDQSPGRGDALRELAWLDYLDGARDKARDEFGRAAKLLPADPRVLLGVALLDDEEGRSAAALDGWLTLLERADGTDPWTAAARSEAASQVGRLIGEVPGEEALGRRLAALDVRGYDDDARERVLAARVRLARRHGDESGAMKLDAERGCPAHVMTWGPFGHLPVLDLETPFDADARDPQGAVEAPGRNCYFAVVTPQGKHGVAYAVVYARAMQAGVFKLRVLSERPWKLLIDGRTVFRGLSADWWTPVSTTLDVSLAAGLHRVALKVAASESRTLAALRVSPESGLALLEGAPAPSQKAASASAGASATLHQGTLLPSRAVAGEQPRLALWLGVRRALLVGNSATAESLSARLEREAPRFVPALLAAAEVDSGDPSRPRKIMRDRARRHLEQALALDPACLAARYQLADFDLEDDHPDRALVRLGGAPSNESWRLAWGRYKALHARDWDVEAEKALADAHAKNPDACQPLEGEVQVALARHDSRRALVAARALVACAPESDQLAEIERSEAADPAAAATEFRRLLAIDPARQSVLRGLGESLSALGDVRGAAEVWRRLVALEPRVATWRRLLADALLEAGDAAGARRAILDGLAQSPEAQELHRALLALAGPGAPGELMQPFRLDGRRVIADFEKAGRRYDSPAVIVLDRTITRVFPTGARLTLTHNIMRVQTKEGIDKFGEVTISDAADVLLLRAVKADGSTHEAQEISGKRSVSVPDLAPGDYVEFEYIEPAGTPMAFPGGFYGERFFFQSFDAPLDRTEYVVATPAGMPLQVDVRGDAPKVALHAIDDPLGGAARLDVRTWADRQKAQLTPEPQQTPITEFVPSVRVASGVSFAGWRDFLADQQFGTLRANRELRELATKLGTPETIDEWVRRHVKQGGTLDEAATSVLARGEGSRVVLEAALLHAIGIPTTIWLARALTGAQLEGPLPDLEGYDEPLLAIGTTQAGGSQAHRTIVADPRFRHSPLGFVAPLLRGARALSLGGAGEPEVRFVTVPGDFDEGGKAARDVTLEATLAADGSADVTVRERLTGWPAIEWREGLDRIDENNVRAQFEQHTLGYYFPGATLTALEFGPRDRDDEPFAVAYRFHAPRFARIDGDRLVLPAPYPALLARHYVGVAARKTPLQLAYTAPNAIEVIVRLPPGATATPAPAVALPGFGRFAQRVDVEPGVVRLRGSFAIPPERVPPGRYVDFTRWADSVDRAEARAAVVELRVGGAGSARQP